MVCSESSVICSLKYKRGCRCINPCTQIQDTLWNQHEWENTVNMGGIK